MYGKKCSLLRAIQSLNAESEARVRVCKEGEWFVVKAGLWQGCVMREIMERMGDVRAHR